MAAQRIVVGRTNFDGLSWSVRGEIVRISGKVTEGPIGCIGRRLEFDIPIEDLVRLAGRFTEEAG